MSMDKKVEVKQFIQTQIQIQIQKAKREAILEVRKGLPKEKFCKTKISAFDHINFQNALLREHIMGYNSAIKHIKSYLMKYTGERGDYENRKNMTEQLETTELWKKAFFSILISYLILGAFLIYIFLSK